MVEGDTFPSSSYCMGSRRETHDPGRGTRRASPEDALPTSCHDDEAQPRRVLTRSRTRGVRVQELSGRRVPGTLFHLYSNRVQYRSTHEEQALGTRFRGVPRKMVISHEYFAVSRNSP